MTTRPKHLLLLSAVTAALALAAPTGQAAPGPGSGDLSRFNAGTELLRLPDGRILAAGTAGDCAGLHGCATRPRILLARFEPDGSLDPTFGDGDGVASTELGGTLEPRALAVLPNGRIVVAGTLFGGSDGFSDLGVLKFLSTGATDESFGPGGLRVVDLGGNTVADSVVAWGPDVFAVGGWTIGGEATGDADWLLARFDENGLDTGFGGNGLVTTDVDQPDVSGWADTIYDLVRTPQGQLLAAGAAGNAFGIARYEEDGTLDPSFGGDGIAETAFQMDRPGLDPFAQATDLLVLEDGDIIAGGVAGERDSRYPRQAAIARYLADGSLDSGFGDGTGHVYGGCPSVGGLLLTANARLVVPAVTPRCVEILEVGNGELRYSGSRSVQGPGPVLRTAVTENGGLLAIGFHAYRSRGSWRRSLVVGRYDLAGRRVEGFGTHGAALLPPVPRCGTRAATTVGTARPDELVGRAGVDVIVGMGGADRLVGLDGSDLICGRRGADTLLGGEGEDRLRGEAGDDRISGGSGADYLFGGPGTDRLRGGFDRDRLFP